MRRLAWEAQRAADAQQARAVAAEAEVIALRKQVKDQQEQIGELVSTVKKLNSRLAGRKSA